MSAKRKKRINMAKKDYYIIEKNLNRIYHDEPTNFLDPLTYKRVISKLGKSPYNAFYPYSDSEKVIIYIKKEPIISLLEIFSFEPLTHREIMGSLFSLGIDNSLFGDIIITNNHYYVIVINQVADLIKNELKQIGNHHITIEYAELSILENYKRVYKEIEIIVSSLRIDNVIATIIGTSRESIKREFIDDNVILNYEICHRVNYSLKENDVFSIRRHGKYKFGSIMKETKKGNYLIKCYKYTEN